MTGLDPVTQASPFFILVDPLPSDCAGEEAVTP